MNSKYVGTQKQGRVKAGVFEQEDGSYQFAVEKPYKNKETGEWLSSKSLYGNDIIDLHGLCETLIEKFELEKNSSSGWFPSGQSDGEL